MRWTRFMAVLACTALATPVRAQEPVSDEQSLLELRNTVINLMQALVERGMLTQQDAQAMVAAAQESAEAEIAELRAGGLVEEGAVRVTHVPDIVKEEIQAAVREDVQEAVVEDVVARARTEGWGIPAALPNWVRGVDIVTSLRVREEGHFFDESNALNTYLDFNAINAAGGIGRAGVNALMNTSIDRTRFRGRVYVDLAASITPSLTARFGVSTGTLNENISLNETLSTYGRRLAFTVQKASIEWRLANEDASRGFDLYAGRFDRPFLSTSLMFDEDLAFEGLATKMSFDVFRRGTPGVQPGVSLLLGAFPIEEVALATDDKFLYAGQLGFEFPMGPRNSLRLMSAYYAFENIVGLRNAPDSQLNDYTAPPLFGRGNTLFDIRNDLDPDTNRFALAAEYEIANATVQLDFGAFGDTRIILTADYIENRGFDPIAVAGRIGQAVDARVEGRQIELAIGRTRLEAAGNWRVSAAYRYLERDATLDAFIDSDWGLGATDTEGYVLGFELGVARNTWFTLKALSSNEIDGPPLSIDVLQLDIDTRF